MRRIALAASLLLVLATPSFATGTSFDTLRREHASVDKIIARLPSGGIRGTFSHISQMLEQNRVADLPPGSSDSLPAGFDHQMANAFERLDSDLQRGLPSLPLPLQINLAQITVAVAFERNLELYSDHSPCPPTVSCPDDPQVLVELDRIAATISAAIRVGLIDYEARTGNDLTAAKAAAGRPVTGRDLPGWLDDVRTTAVYIPGVEDIDH